MLDPPTLTGSYGSTSSSLLARARQRDPAAWQRLVQLYSPLVYYWCRNTRLRAEDSADLVQEVFRSVAGGLGRFSHEAENASFRAWLRTITLNKLRNFLRKQQAMAEPVGGSEAHKNLLEIADRLAVDDSSFHESDIVLVCKRALELVEAEFQPQTWQVFWRVFIEGQYPAHVAADVGISIGAIYKAKSRVLARLRQELGDLL
jgi:RNA polymerase sigma-70 factor (ECF subfamily)